MTTRRRWFPALMSALLLSCVWNAHAALKCIANGVYLNMFAGTYGGFFGFDDDFANLAIGDRVGPMREVNLSYSCTITSTTAQFGVGRKAAPGITHDAVTDTYTNPQLSARGLGYRIWWHQMKEFQLNYWYPEDINPDLTVNAIPYQWVTPLPGTYAAGSFQLMIPVRVTFFKINNNFQNTNGSNTTLSPTITANLFRFYVADVTTPSTVAGDMHTFTLTLNRFSSAKRVCTPLGGRDIQLSTLPLTDLPPSGVVTASTQAFSLTFDCPYMAWYTVGFRVEGVYGTLDAQNGVFGIKQGAGYAQGLGIQLEAENLATGWTGNMNSTSPWQVLKPGTDYSIPWFEYSNSAEARQLNPATTQRTRVVNFRAAYYRLPNTSLAAGKIESAILIHFVYK